MVEKQTVLKESLGEHWQYCRKLMPEFAGMYDGLSGEAYLDGAVKARDKRLMALTAAIIRDCRGCILFQTERAMEQGATVEQVLETIAVAIALGGSLAASASTRVIQYLREQQHI
ncbi:carboxymuconolactone decarboxylase family protein [Salidesulfovibrio onnuriiensis]|uniref:carboxymuconolactone decarboxylase family protein n=1 Tax=Salidesulfovibrio onnuriiensis TaxID=2583823 RepID=UPI0011C87DAD|nr:carboxymuconolactone decarboxylase family protein [Salidesulfovibrio onnuriiensis]